MKAHVKKKKYKAHVREKVLEGLVNDPITGSWISLLEAKTKYRVTDGTHKYVYEGTAKTNKRRRKR
jgi:hypothetical protein